MQRLPIVGAALLGEPWPRPGSASARVGVTFALGLAVLSGPRTLCAQQARTTTVVAGAHYHAGWLHRLMLGAHYRDLWATPLEVEELDLARFGGGLTPISCGGGRETKVLRFLGADGRAYAFRSIDKDPTLALPPDLRATFARDLIQDQISSAHPGAPLVVAPLLDAATVLNAQPRIVLLPDDPRLAGFDCVRPGFKLGMIEERPKQGPDNEPGFAGASDLVRTKQLFEYLKHDPRHRIDSRAFLAARLMDVFIGDWDRHQDQWRWARFDSAEVHWWRPIPRDRDQAFARLDGVLVWLAGFYQPQVVGFGDDYPSIWRLTFAGEVLDRRLLGDLERPVWDSVATVLQQRLTDSVIDAAVRRLPPEYYRPSLARALKRRRDHLREVAGRYYELRAQVVDIHGTDERDVAEIERQGGGRVEVKLSSARSGPNPYFRRTFDRRDTREIRLYLHAGDDRVVVRGSDRSGPLVRVIAGGGDAELLDSAQAGPTRFYVEPGRTRTVTGPGTAVDRRHYAEPLIDTTTLDRPRDWGSRWVPLTWVDYTSDVGLFVGAGAVGTSYGFRQFPYGSQLMVRGGYATAAATYRAEFNGEFRAVVPPATVTLHLRASGIDVLRYYGFGNETVDTGSADFYKVKQQQYLVAPALRFTVSPAAALSLGPVFKFTHTNLEAGTFIAVPPAPYGVRDLAQLGAAADFQLDTRDVPRAASRGVSLRLGGSVYPAALDVTSSFGEGHAEATSYLTAPIALRPTLALRVAAKKVWGTYPLHEAAFVGGATTVRGFAEHRFVGDAAVYGNVELRLSIARFFFLVPTDVGVFGLGDAGRVYLAGETSDRWHGAAGGGLWLSFLHPTNTLSVAVANSIEGTRVYVRAGFAY